MRGPLDGVSDADVAAFVAARWALDIASIEYVPEGGGAYHWCATTDDGGRWFVTCDDLATKPWLGTAADDVFAALTDVYGAAVALRDEGLGFVVAPEPSAAGAVAERFDPGHSVAVFAFVEGVPGRWGEPGPSDATDVAEMLGVLHRAQPTVALPRRGLDVPGRDELDAALAEPTADAAWIREALARLDRLAARLGAADDDDGANLVVTHGEPHPGNLIRTASGLALLDWDTVAIARPERDLWMLASTDPGLDVDPDAVEAYRLLWALADVAAFTRQLRLHPDTVDAARARIALRQILDGDEPAPYGRAEYGQCS